MQVQVQVQVCRCRFVQVCAGLCRFVTSRVDRFSTREFERSWAGYATGMDARAMAPQHFPPCGTRPCGTPPNPRVSRGRAHRKHFSWTSGTLLARWEGPTRRSSSSHRCRRRRGRWRRIGLIRVQVSGRDDIVTRETGSGRPGSEEIANGRRACRASTETMLGNQQEIGICEKGARAVVGRDTEILERLGGTSKWFDW